ncbi:MAG: helix-turn-helix transcriptional regulator [Acidimicrobiia bacterium]
MDTTQLNRTLGDLTSSLGDPTRRAIYITVRESAEPVTTSMLAELFGIHPNVARHHLDRLAADGYLRVTHRRPSGRVGPGAGRPAKCYEATAKEISLHFPARRYDLLVELLVRVLDRVASGQVAEVAEQIGREYGAELASEIGAPDDAGYPAAVRAVTRAMTGLGFQMSADVPAQRLLTSHCPFGAAATGHPEVVCSLDRGIVAGLMQALHQDCQPVVIPHIDLIDDCVTEIPVQISGRR